MIYETHKVLFVECDSCGFGVEFKFDSRIFHFCKEHRFGINVASDDTRARICGVDKQTMEHYTLLVEDNLCPICEKDILNVCYVPK